MWTGNNFNPKTTKKKNSLHCCIQMNQNSGPESEELKGKECRKGGMATERGIRLTGRKKWELQFGLAASGCIQGQRGWWRACRFRLVSSQKLLSELQIAKLTARMRWPAMRGPATVSQRNFIADSNSADRPFSASTIYEGCIFIPCSPHPPKKCSSPGKSRNHWKK